MTKMREPRRDPLEVLRKYKEAGEPVPPAEQVESILATIRTITLQTLYRNCEGIDIALGLLHNELSPEEWIRNGLWQDLFDHIVLNYQGLTLAQLLQDRMTTEQVWMVQQDELSLGVGLTLWNDEQVEALPVGSVIRWKQDDEFVVGVQTRPFAWRIVGKSGEFRPNFPAIILASPPDEEEFEVIERVCDQLNRQRDED